MENRILQFNGSNERAIFSLGQNYWGLFYDLHRLLDSLADETILQDSVQLDTTWFLAQTFLLEQYHNRARSLFDRMETPERRAQAVKFYSPDDVAALIYKLKGSMWTGQFESAYHQNADLPPDTQLNELRALIARADSAYAAIRTHAELRQNIQYLPRNMAQPKPGVYPDRATRSVPAGADAG